MHVDGAATRCIRPAAPAGVAIGGRLDAWLAAQDAAPLAARVPVLAYGSNRCPSKITWLRRALGLAPARWWCCGPARPGVAAVWAAGLRARDGARPAVLAAAPGVVEDHAVWLATPDQIAVLDRCEGRDDRFRLARLRTGHRPHRGRRRVDGPWCYLGLPPHRTRCSRMAPVVRCTQLDQAAARRSAPQPGEPRGRRARRRLRHGCTAPRRVAGAPVRLRPAAARPVGLAPVEPHLRGQPRPAVAAGTILDTGLGYPTMRQGDGAAPGAVVPLDAPGPCWSTWTRSKARHTNG